MATARPRNTLDIEWKKVNKAYLAKREDKFEKTSTTYGYTFGSNDNNTGDDKGKDKIAKIIFDKETNNGNINNTDFITTVEQIKSTFTEKKYNKGDCIDIPIVKSKVKFTEIKTANLGDEVYVVIETENLPNKEIRMNLKQAVKKGIQMKDDPLTVQQNNKDVKIFKATVGEFAKDQNVINSSDFTDMAIAKIKLEPKNKDKKKEYIKALNDADDKKTNIYLVINAESENNSWVEVIYDSVEDATPNLWYDGDGEWFEFVNDITLRKDDKNEMVREINIRLAGFGGNVPTDVFTQRTEDMVKQFQKDYMKIETTGIITEKEYAAIDKFADEYPISFEQTKCNCGKCTGFGNGKFSSQKQKSTIKERFRKYEYPGIHRTLLWTLKSTMFYLSNNDKSHNLKFGKIHSGYRCHVNNTQNDRTTTNHMGKALDVHFYKTTDLITTEKNCDVVRDKILIKRSGAQLRWKNKNHVSLEASSKDRIGDEFIATNWVHYDVREFDLEYLTDNFFIKSLENQKSIKDLLNG